MSSPPKRIITAVHMETSQYLWRRRVENPFAMYAHGLAVWKNACAHPSFRQWTCHGGCAYAYVNFAQAVQISKFYTFEALTVNFFFICTGFYIQWTCIFHGMCNFFICTATDGDGFLQTQILFFLECFVAYFTGSEWIQTFAVILKQYKTVYVYI